MGRARDGAKAQARGAPLTAGGQPPSGVAPAAVTGPPAPAGGSGGGGDDGDSGDGGDDGDIEDGTGESSGDGAGGGRGTGDTHGGYFSKRNRPMTPVEGHPSQDGRLEGRTGETLMSPGGLGGGGHNVPRLRGYSCKPSSPSR